MQEAKHGNSMEDWSGDAFRSTETKNSRKWTEDWREFEGILDTGVKIHNGEEDHGNNVALPRKRRDAGISYSSSNHPNEAEGFQEQLKGFVKSTGELLEKLAQGCRDVVRQNLGGEDSVLVRRVGGMWAKFSPHMEVVNQFLPEDRNPAHVWSVLLFVFFLTVAVLEQVRSSKNQLLRRSTHFLSLLIVFNFQMEGTLLIGKTGFQQAWPDIQS